jgi:hypothetical protein
MALTKIKLDQMVTGTLPDANIPDTITIDVASAVPASGLTGNTLASGVTASSLTSTGTLGVLNVTGAQSGDFLAKLTSSNAYGLYVKTVGTTTSHDLLKLDDNTGTVFKVMATGETTIGGTVTIDDNSSLVDILVLDGTNAPSIKFITPQDDWRIGSHLVGSGHDLSIQNVTLTKNVFTCVNDTVGLGGHGSSNGTDPTGFGLIVDGTTATFAGNVQANEITTAASSYSGKMYMDDGSAHSSSASYLTFESMGDRGIDIRSQSQIRVYTDNANTLALTLDASQNATFAGNLTTAIKVTAGSTYASADKMLNGVSDGGSTQQLGLYDTRADTSTRYSAVFHRVGNNGSMTWVGSIANTSSSVAFNTSSDYRMKENVDYVWDATTRLKALKPCRFNWITDESNTLYDGFLAHEVSAYVPNAVQEEKDGEIMQSIDHSKLVPLLVKTIQELEARIELMENA